MFPVPEGADRDKSFRDGRARPRPLFPPHGPRQPRPTRPSPDRRRGGRRRQDILAERARLKEQTEREIDAIHAEYARLILGRPHLGIATIYARYSTEFQQSVGDQIRACLEEAARLGLVVDRAHVFYDLAVSGMKERRPGLDQVRTLLAAKGAKVLLALTTNRLFRKMYKCMRFVEEELVERGHRCIFVKTGIDTAQGQQWRLPLQVHSLVDEMSATMYAANIRTAHEGMFLKNWVISTLPYGYAGRDVEGPPTKRGRPRQAVAIDPEEAAWATRIFACFVADRLPMARILERLNGEQALLPPKAVGGYWTHQALHYLLENPCYRGEWAYGRGENVLVSQKDYVKRRRPDQSLKTQHVEHLRLVSDERSGTRPRNC